MSGPSAVRYKTGRSQNRHRSPLHALLHTCLLARGPEVEDVRTGRSPAPRALDLSEDEDEPIGEAKEITAVGEFGIQVELMKPSLVARSTVSAYSPGRSWVSRSRRCGDFFTLPCFCRRGS